MARGQRLTGRVHTWLSAMINASVLQLILVVTALAEKCTRAVPVQTKPAKKVQILRRVPATCSNWDKAWSWLTKVDCGTKYRLDYVTVPPRETQQYKLQYVCCDDDVDCKEAENIHAGGFDSTDEKFLAVVLGSTAACVIIIIIIFAITFYTKKTRCSSLCDQDSHIYSSTACEGSGELAPDTEKGQHEDAAVEREQKACESDYAEIGEPHLPRYTDIFKEGSGEDPFHNASAPPLYSEIPPRLYANTTAVQSASTRPANKESSCDVHIVSDSVPENGAPPGARTSESNTNPKLSQTEEKKYYNMKEKKKRKKKSRASSRGGDVRGGDVRGGDVRREERAQASVCSSSKPNKRNRRSSSSVDMELMVKSSSASETFGKTSETSLTNEKRRSAPPGVLPVAIGVIHARPPWVPTKSPSSTGGCTTQTQCVIHEAPPLPPRCPINSANSKPRTPPGHPPRSNSHPPVPRSHPPRSRSSSSSVALPSVPSGGETYQNSRFQAADPSEAPTIPHAAAELPAAPSCRGHDSPRSSPDLCDTECAHAEYSNAPCEQDSLLRTTSCHSGCGSEHSFEDCSQCSYYDKLKCTTGSEGDLASLHTYQCLNGSSHDLTFDSSISGQFPSKSETYVNGSAVLLSQKQK